MEFNKIKETLSRPLGRPLKARRGRKELSEVSIYIHNRGEDYIDSLHNYINSLSENDTFSPSALDSYIGDRKIWEYWQISVAVALVSEDIEKQHQKGKELRMRRNVSNRLQDMLNNEKAWDKQTISPEEQGNLDSAAKKLVK